MSDRFTVLSRLAAEQHGAVSVADLERAGVGPKLRWQWVRRELLVRAGPRAYFIAGSVPTWERAAWAVAANVDGRGILAGRSAARVHGLDGFGADHRPEVLLDRRHRGVRLPYTVRFTSGSVGSAVRIDGIRCQTAEALILTSSRFDFTAVEVDNAIDSARRMRKVHEGRLRQRVLAAAVPGGDVSHLRAALVDTGSESRLERWFLGVVREGVCRGR